MSNKEPAKVTYDQHLIRQTCGKLYTVDDKGALQLSGNWCFQFSGESPNEIDVVVSLSGNSSMAAAMGAPMTSTGEMNKESVQELKAWLTDILQQMNESKPKDPS